MKDKFELLRDSKVLVVEAAAAAAQTLLTTDVVDMQGFDSVVFIVLLGDVTDTSALALTAYTNDTNDTNSPTELALPVSFTAGASDADNKLLILELHKPRDRYVYATLARGTANAVVNGILAVLTNARERPVAQDAVVIASRFINDPAPV